MLSVDADFPAGNVIVLGIDGDSLTLDRDLRDTKDDWFWWCCRVRGAAGRTITLNFPERELVGPRGAAMSVNGSDWRWSGPDTRRGPQTLTLAVPDDAASLFLAFSFPYPLAALTRFLGRMKNVPTVAVRELTVSEGGRSVPLVEIRRPGATKHVFLCARHHACECTASFALEGMMEALAFADEFLAGHCVHVIPLADIDGVERGDHGKNRRPHDHNRDFTDCPIYAEPRALMELATALGRSAIVGAIDMHAPYKWGGRNDSVFVVEPPGRWLAGQHRFNRLLKEATAGSGLTYDGTRDIPFGVEWNVNELSRSMIGFFRRAFPSIPLAFTLEVTYCLNGEQALTPENAREFGRCAARAMTDFYAASFVSAL